MSIQIHYVTRNHFTDKRYIPVCDICLRSYVHSYSTRMEALQDAIADGWKPLADLGKDLACPDHEIDDQ